MSPTDACSLPLFGPLLFLHQKKYVKGGSVEDATVRVDAICARGNRPIAEGGAVWVGVRNASTPPAGMRCGWMSPKGQAARFFGGI